MNGLVSGGGHIGKPAYVDSWLCLTQIQSEEELQAKGNHPTSKIHFASFLPELQRRSLKILEEPVRSLCQLSTTLGLNLVLSGPT